MQPDIVRAAIKAGVSPSDLGRIYGVSRAAIHKHARRSGIALRQRPSRTPTREGWMVLMAQHGDNLVALAAVTGLRRDYVRECLERWELVECVD